MNKISYLIALYNKSNFILDAIASILDDSSEEYDLEICVVDDGSDDDSLGKVKHCYANDNRVKIYSFPVNRGKVAAYNKAYTMSSGGYLCIFGADDEIVKGRNKKLLKSCQESAMSSYGCLLKEVYGVRQDGFMPHHKNISFHKNIINNMLAGGASMIIKKDAEAIFPIPEHLKFEDWWVSFHLLRLNSVRTIDSAVTVYKIHGSNDCGSAASGFDILSNDYKRHESYLKSFFPYLKSKKDYYYIRRSLDLRRAFFGQKKIVSIFTQPFDRTSLKLLAYIFPGARALFGLRGFLGSLLCNFKVDS